MPLDPGILWKRTPLVLLTMQTHVDCSCPNENDCCTRWGPFPSLVNESSYENQLEHSNRDKTIEGIEVTRVHDLAARHRIASTRLISIR